MIIFNDNATQISVQWITLYIKGKRKIYDNLGHKNNALILTIPIVYFGP